MAWLVTAFMGLQSLGYYATTAYLPTILTDAGLSQSLAGLMLSLANLVGIAGAFSAPVLAGRGVKPGLLATVAAVLTAGGLIGLVLAPIPDAYLWIVLLGFGQSASFSLALLFIVLRAPDGRHAAQLSSMAQCCGYLLAAVGPLALGAVHQVTGAWAVPLVILLALLGPQTVAGLGAARSQQARRNGRLHRQNTRELEGSGAGHVSGHVSGHVTPPVSAGGRACPGSARRGSSGPVARPVPERTRGTAGRSRSPRHPAPR